MRKLTSIILAAGLLMGCAVSCDGGEPSGYIEAGITDMGTFDFDKTVGDIELYGTAVKLPGKFDDLGSGFSVKDGFEPEGGDTAGTTFKLLHDGKEVGSVLLENCSEGDSPNGKKIKYIEFTDMDNFKMNGISGKSTIEDVKTRFGTPSSTDSLYISYSGKNGGYIEFYKVGPSAKAIQYVVISF